MKFKTPYNYVDDISVYEKPIGVSLTIPDQSLTVKEILDRFVSGIAPPLSQDGYYDDDADYDDDVFTNAVDRTDIEEQLRELNERAEIRSAHVNEQKVRNENKVEVPDKDVSEQAGGGSSASEHGAVPTTVGR